MQRGPKSLAALSSDAAKSVISAPCCGASVVRVRGATRACGGTGAWVGTVPGQWCTTMGTGTGTCTMGTGTLLLVVQGLASQWYRD